ncbi:C45 family peptidase [Phytomonospora sp. NPDC050363]|uniref:C45 family peptidase n=1 Tax=Phytomonospora sp. NPDC050363 TaxID=3155642 RepID=UPI0033DC7A30
MTTTPLPHLTLSGSPREQGLTHGRALADDIAANIALYARRLHDDAGLTDAEVNARAAVYLEVFGRADPAYREMMEGIAEGSGQPLAAITVLNARYEVLYSAWSAAGVAHDVDECTSFGILREAATDGRQRIGQNWDWFPDVRCALLRVEEPGRTVLGFTEAGIAGVKIGVNDAGVALCVNGLTSDSDDWTRAGIPFHLRTWRALHSSTVAEAVGHLTTGVADKAVSNSANFMVGGPEAVVDVELAPVAANEIACEGVLVHANHFTDPAALGVTETWRHWPPTTYDRNDRLSTLLGTGPVDPAALPAKLRDHENGANALCRHPIAAQEPHQRIHTALSVVIDVDARELSYTAGPPCESEYTTVAL